MKKTDLYMMILGALILIGFFALIGILIFVGIKESNQSLLYLITGGLIGNVTSIIGYYFGSSHGSKVKTDMLQDNKITDGSMG